MKVILNNKLYDTDKASILFEFRKKCKGDDCWFKPGYAFYYWTDVQIYKTTKGNYFLHYDKTNEYLEFIEETNENEVKRIIKKLNPDKYLELFGKIDIEEA